MAKLSWNVIRAATLGVATMVVLPGPGAAQTLSPEIGFGSPPAPPIPRIVTQVDTPMTNAAFPSSVTLERMRNQAVTSPNLFGVDQSQTNNVANGVLVTPADSTPSSPSTAVTPFATSSVSTNNSPLAAGGGSSFVANSAATTRLRRPNPPGTRVRVPQKLVLPIPAPKPDVAVAKAPVRATDPLPKPVLADLGTSKASQESPDEVLEPPPIIPTLASSEANPQTSDLQGFRGPAGRPGRTNAPVLETAVPPVSWYGSLKTTLLFACILGGLVSVTSCLMYGHSVKLAAEEKN